MAKVTIYDIAKVLNVSPASVTRALNGQPKVSAERRELIIKTANRMGYSANQLAVSLSRRTIKIAVLIYAGVEEFYSKIASGIEESYKNLKDYNVKKDLYTANNNDDFVEIFKTIGREQYDGLLIHSTHDNQTVRNAVNDYMERRKIPIFTINSDISIERKHSCVMSNSHIAGKMAAELLDWTVPNRKICFFKGGKEANALSTISEAFISESKERNLEILEDYYDDDNVSTAYQNVNDMIKNHPDVGGIYISSAISYAVCNRLLETGVARNLKIVSSDFLPDIRFYLKNGFILATIYQNPFLQGKLGFRNVFRAITEGTEFDEEILVTPLIITKSNISQYDNSI
jgi:LacI family transcriptional regulator